MKVVVIGRQYFTEINDPHTVVADPQARYFGALLTGRVLVPGESAYLGTTNFDAWMAAQRKPV
ncbi:hypothetical protein AAHN97_06990 [Chitinophaga niabensis]|uniref:hypothetical protein n=1 Tax=Chitinophaga niabensis TaxID=536979 RepID=UPI0031BA1605